jgi:hypothetical protein
MILQKIELQKRTFLERLEWFYDTNPINWGTTGIILFLLLLFYLGLKLYIKVGKKNYQKAKKEFERTNKYGTIEYENYEEYSKSVNQGTLIKVFGNLGGVIMGLSAVFLAFLLFMVWDDMTSWIIKFYELVINEDSAYNEIWGIKN